MVHNICCQFKISWLEKTYIDDRRAAGSVTMIKFDMIHKFRKLFKQRNQQPE